jgi:mercuric ion binding protein
MKKLVSALLIMIAAQSTAFGAAKEIHITVNGMVCAFCAQGITKKFSAEPAVEKVNVSLEKKKVDLALKDGQDLSDETIRRVLTEAGYAIQKIERN